MSDNKKIYKLKHPVDIDYQAAGAETRTEKLTEVTIRRPNGADMRLTDDYAGRPMAMMLALLARVTGLDDYKIDRLDKEDIEAMMEIVEGF